MPVKNLKSGSVKTRGKEGKKEKTDGELLVSWREELAAGGGRKAHLANLSAVVRRFLAFLETVGRTLRDVDGECVDAFQGLLVASRSARNGEALKTSTVEAHMRVTRRFLEHLVKTGVLLSNPARETEIPRGVKNPPLGLLKEEELGRYLDALGDWEREEDLRSRMWAYRSYVMAETQYATGLRMSELGALTEEDLDLERFEVRVRRGKGGVNRVGYLTVWTADVLRAYLSMRPLVVKGGEKRNRYLFGPAGENLCRAYNIRLNKVARELGLGRFYNHKFRHELGYHLLRAGCPIRSVQGILGHERLRTTELYTKVDAEDIRGVLDSRHPRP